MIFADFISVIIFAIKLIFLWFSYNFCNLVIIYCNLILNFEI